MESQLEVDCWGFAIFPVYSAAWGITNCRSHGLNINLYIHEMPLSTGPICLRIPPMPCDAPITKCLYHPSLPQHPQASTILFSHDKVIFSRKNKLFTFPNGLHSSNLNLKLVWLLTPTRLTYDIYVVLPSVQSNMSKYLLKQPDRSFLLLFLYTQKPQRRTKTHHSMNPHHSIKPLHNGLCHLGIGKQNDAKPN